VYGTFFAATTRHIALGQQQCESMLALAWYQEINDVLGKSQEKHEEKKLSGAEQSLVLLLNVMMWWGSGFIVRLT
jgi:hypothetical protein